jgi:hypothetical protein
MLHLFQLPHPQHTIIPRRQNLLTIPKPLHSPYRHLDCTGKLTECRSTGTVGDSDNPIIRTNCNQLSILTKGRRDCQMTTGMDLPIRRKGRICLRHAKRRSVLRQCSMKRTAHGCSVQLDARSANNSQDSVIGRDIGRRVTRTRGYTEVDLVDNGCRSSIQINDTRVSE